jgi:hypothetical protein
MTATTSIEEEGRGKASISQTCWLHPIKMTMYDHELKFGYLRISPCIVEQISRVKRSSVIADHTVLRSNLLSVPSTNS